MNLDTSKTDPRLGGDRVQAIFESHAPSLKRFLVGLLRDDATSDDALQSTFAKLVEKGHTANEDSIKSWLFQVAFNEAMMVRRKNSTRQKLFEQAAWTIHTTRQAKSFSGLEATVQGEEVARVRLAIRKLNPDQQAVLKARIYDGIKFKDIAEQFGVPMGTVLSRMQAALKQLKLTLSDQESTRQSNG